MFLDQVGPKLQEIATSRWLLPEEIFLLLVNPPSKLGLPQTFVAPGDPQPGQIFIYDDRALFKQDGIVWAKKKGATDRLQETYMNLKVGGKDCIRGIYIKGAVNPNFRRRIYRLSVKLLPQSYVLVHYRECLDDEKPERHTLQPLIAYFINQQQQLLNNAPTQAGPGDKQDKSEKDKVDKHDKEKDNHHHHHQHTHVNAVSAASSFPGNDDFLDDFFDMEVAPPEYDIRQGLAGGDDIFPLFSFSTKPSMGYQSSASKLLSAMDQQGDNSSNSWPSPADLSSFSFYAQNGPVDQISVLDFAPNKIFEDNEGVKFMICFAQPVLRRDLMIKLSIPNNEKLFFLEWICDNVAVWSSASVGVGHWSVTIVSNKNEFVCAASTFLEILPTPSSENHYSRSKRPLDGSPGSQFVDATDPALNHVLDNDRQFKIRLVEKLGHIQSALEHDESMGPRSRSSSKPPYLITDPNYPQPRSRSSSRPPYLDPAITPRSRSSSRTPYYLGASGVVVDSEGVEWLDDTVVSSLTNQELEEVMDRYIAAVVRQLVQLGSLDEDLRAEIDDVDSNGLSLLHYCCLYNLTSLIPVLLARGADVNQCTLSGSSPLHLAAAAGNLTVTQELLKSGANVHAVDGNSRTALDIARESGRADIFGALCSAMNQPSITFETQFSGQHDARSSLANAHDRDSVSSMTAMLLQQTFSTLSLTDKCALSLSLGGTDRALIRQALAANRTVTPSLEGSDHLGNAENAIVADISKRFAKAANNGANNIPDDMSDIQSVISETDKESLDAAMSMMGHIELQQVDEEVRKIQNNVRGWLLRKNFTNLREATKILQTAWREKKKSSIQTRRPGDREALASIDEKMEMEHPDDMRDCPSTLLPTGSVMQRTPVKGGNVAGTTRRPSGGERGPNTPNPSEKAMASLVIQKNLVRWWTHSKTGLIPDDSLGRPLSAKLSTMNPQQNI